MKIPADDQQKLADMVTRAVSLDLTPAGDRYVQGALNIPGATYHLKDTMDRHDCSVMLQLMNKALLKMVTDAYQLGQNWGNHNYLPMIEQQRRENLELIEIAMDKACRFGLGYGKPCVKEPLMGGVGYCPDHHGTMCASVECERHAEAVCETCGIAFCVQHGHSHEQW